MRHATQWSLALSLTLAAASWPGCGTGNYAGDEGTGGAGVARTGGATGMSTGGTTSTGGRAGTTGGTTGSATGGATATGGMTGTGGTNATGGRTNTGGRGGAGGGATATGGRAGGGASGTGGSSGTGSGNGLPCEVTSLLTKCASCHGATPAGGAPSSLVTYADLTGPAKSDPTKSEAAVALARLNNTASPMPPAGYTRPTSAEISAMQAWVTAGTPSTSCKGSTPDGGVPMPDGGSATGGTSGADAGMTANDPLNAAPKCTSNTTWTQGNRGSASMNPGMACISCHSTSGGEAPTFAIAGTLYPTGHEPDKCNGVNGSTAGAKIVITGANGQSVTLTPNNAGNFDYTGSISKPYKAKVTYMGRERAMAGSQTSGDCNSCHTQNGASSAPGRITLP